ncbi:MMPL family transporter [Acutalibacter muris]|uniref:Antibiotic ABC transporter permease n=1 Tax=Acutalibacter muris TaxID=1796620 RepID=A0A1Z2XWF2_9FIRM|nr:antibiotic ABC transporter permease [Hungateiclostridiaceae bacterium KB18]ASB42762.1 antibiotic ABC transporter permease [Acutalibacter muris]QQR31986.1 MMPL family transporter [Acutalibacter muris]
MEKLARGIVRRRRLVLVLAVLLLIPALLGAAATRINYDILTYLPPELDSMLGEQALENDFNLASTGMITVEGMPLGELLDMKAQMEQVPGVEQVFWLSDIIDPALPREMLPEGIQKAMYGENATLMLVRFSEPSASKSTMDAVAELKGLLREHSFMGGMSVILQDTKALVDQEMPLYILCAVGASLLVLFLAMESTLVPVLFMIGLLFPILYNFGTNYFLGQISYITQALSTVLQLGVTMDFSIFLLHRYEEEKLRSTDKEQAMATAIVNTFSSITASSLTTIAGFLALCTMRLTLGRDIGIVMAKGVALGVVCTVTILPSLILTFDRAVEKHRHRAVIPQLKRVSQFVTRHPGPILAVFLVITIPFTLAQSKTDVYYTLFDSLPQDLTGIVGTNKLKEDFGMTTSHFILVDKDMSDEDLKTLCKDLEGVEGVTQVASVSELLPAGFSTDMLPEDVAQLAQSGGRKLILANSAYKSGTGELTAQLKEMDGLIKAADPSGVITGEGAMTKDLIEIADIDFAHVNVASIAAVFLIILLTFRSASIPVLLVVSIESAIFINMGLPYFTGTQLPFIASIVIGTVQLGATVDYAILMATRFREERQKGLSPKEAAQVACRYCSQSILSSGLTFFAATIGVAAISRMELLKSICLLISRGALISMFVIIVLLPCLLQLLDPLIRHTTLHWLGKRENSGGQSAIERKELV